MQKDFWKHKKLSQLSREEWEALCDGCARCCLEKLEDDDTGEVYYTRVACKILDLESCRCSHYSLRHEYVPECLPITLKNRKMSVHPHLLCCLSEFPPASSRSV